MSQATPKQLRRWFPGLRDDEAWKIVHGDADNNGGHFCSVTVRGSPIRQGPRKPRWGRGRASVHAGTVGHTTRASAMKAVRRALVEIHAELGRLLYDEETSK
jgi:hypothetical protein